MSEHADKIEQRDATSFFQSLDESYIEIEPQPMHLRPIFETIRLKHIELQSQLFASVAEAEAALSTLIAHLEDECQASGVIGQPVFVRGDSLRFPIKATNHFTGETHIRDRTSDELTEELLLLELAGGINGQFSGLGFRLRPFDQEAAIEASYAPQDSPAADISCYGSLWYQVKCGTGGAVNSHSDLFVTGELLHSELEFVTDRRRRELHSVLEQLMSVNSPEAAECINQLNLALVSYVEQTADPDVMLQMAQIVDNLTQIEEIKQTPRYLVEIEQLFNFYLKRRNPVQVAVPEVLLKSQDGYAERTATDKTPISFNQPIASVMLGPLYTVTDDGMSFNLEHQVPYFVFDSSIGVCLVALSRVISLDT